MKQHITLSSIALSIALFSYSPFALAEAETATAKADEKSMSMEDKMKVMAHVSPMPSLMMVLARNEDTLKLNDEQKANFKAFKEEHGSKGKELAKAIMMEEKATTEAVLAGEPAEKINAMLKGVLEKREKFGMAKVACRDNMKKTLTEEQWNKVVELYKVSTNS